MRQFGIFIPAFLLAFIVLHGGRAQAIGESGLIAYWSFNGRDFTDDSGNGRHGFAGEGLPGCVAVPKRALGWRMSLTAAATAA